MQESSAPMSPDPAPVANHASAQADWQSKTLSDLVFANLQEQKIARRWKMGFRAAWLLFWVVILWQVLAHNAPTANITSPHTALVTIKGEIGDGADSSAENIVAAMRNALEDTGSQALVLLINSPGGSPVQSGYINDEIQRLRIKYPAIPLYVVIEDICASGCYYVAAAADKIFVNKASLVGSIGVLMDGFGFTGAMSKLGVERRLMTAGENKGFMDPFSPMNARQQEHVKSMLAEIHQQFIAAVKKGRGKRLKDSADVFSGLIWTGQKGIEMGLADEMGSVESVARDVIKADYIVDFTVHEGITERLAKRFGAGVVGALPGLFTQSGASLR